MSTPQPTHPVHFDLPIRGMTAASCADRVRQALREVEGVAVATVDHRAGVARVVVAPGRVARESLAQAVEAAGFGLPDRGAADDPVGRAAARLADQDREHGGLLRDALLSAALTLPILTLGVFFETWRPGQWTSLVLSAFVLRVPGRRFFEDAVRVARSGVVNLNTLVAVGAGGAWAWSAAAALLPNPVSSADGSFETASVVVTLVLLGRWMQGRAQAKAGAAFRSLLALAPPTARVLRSGASVEVAAAQLRVGDLVLAQPGDRIAADGVVELGRSVLDLGRLAGASAPVSVGPGDPVMAGAVNGHDRLWYRATATGARTVLAGVVRQLDHAQASQPPIQHRIAPFTLRFATMVLALATLTFGAWLLLGPSLSDAALAAVAVLVVASPWAFDEASSVAIQVATGEASLRGIRLRDAAALERLHAVRTVVTRKTGTITQGRFDVVSVSPAPDGLDADTLCASLAAIEAHSGRPWGRALADAAGDVSVPRAEDVAVVPGIGVTATVGGRAWLVGGRRMLDGISVPEAQIEAEEADGRPVLLSAIDGEYAGFVALADPVRPEAAEAVAALYARGVGVVLLSGDSERVTLAVAARVGLRHAEAEVLPEDTARHVEALRRARGGGVAMVGRGVHDAAALVAADVGFALGPGSAGGPEGPAVTVMSSDLRRVARAIDLSRSTMRTIRQNLGWAVAYHLIALPLAAGALYPLFGLRPSPMIAGAAMVLASLGPAANSLRLRSALPTEPR